MTTPNSIPFDQADGSGGYRFKQLPDDSSDFKEQLGLSGFSTNALVGSTIRDKNSVLGIRIDSETRILYDQFESPVLNFDDSGLLGAWRCTGNIFEALGDIVAGANISGSNLSGTNTGDQTIESLGFRAGSFSATGTATTAFSVTIGTTQANTTYKVNVTPTSLVAAAVFYISAKTTTTFTVTYLTGLTGAVAFDWSLSP